jgi:hypothetical protein
MTSWLYVSNTNWLYVSKSAAEEASGGGSPSAVSSSVASSPGQRAGKTVADLRAPLLVEMERDRLLRIVDCSAGDAS